MANRSVLIRAFVASARKLVTDEKPLTEVLGDIRDAIFAGGIQDGKVLIGTAEAGGSTTFAVPPGHEPLELLALAQEAIDYCNQFSDPDNPPTTARRIRRLRVSFAKAIPG